MKISFHLHVNQNQFSYKMSTRTRFEKEAKGNSEMTYCRKKEPNNTTRVHCDRVVVASSDFVSRQPYLRRDPGWCLISFELPGTDPRFLGYEFRYLISLKPRFYPDSRCQLKLYL